MKNLFLKLIILILISISVLFACAPADRYQQEVITLDNGTKQFRGGELKYVEGIAFLKLSGTDYEMGLQHGVLLKEEREQFNKMLDKYSSIPIWLRRLFMRSSLLSSAAQFPEFIQQEMQGLAEGAGVTYVDVVYDNFVGAYGCTSALVQDNNTLLHGRNMDWPKAEMGNYTVVIEYNPEGKYRYVSVMFPGVVTTLTGMNQNGITLSFNASDILGEGEEFDMSVFFTSNKVLATASSMADVDTLPNRFETPLGGMVIIGSAFEQSGAIYDIAGKNVYKNPLGSEPFIGVSNHFKNREYSYDHQWLSGIGTAGNMGRSEMLLQALAEMPDNTPDSLIDVFASADFHDYKSIIGVCGITGGSATPNNVFSLQTVIFDGAKGDMYVSSSLGYSGWAKFLRYNINTGLIETYREADERFEDSLRLSQWWSNTFQCLNRGDFRGILENTDITSDEITPMEVFYVHYAWKFNLVSSEQMIELYDSLIERYPDLPASYLLKADVLIKGGTNYLDEAIALVESTLDSSVVMYPAEEMQACWRLAKWYSEKGDQTKAAGYAQRCLNTFTLYEKQGNIKPHSPVSESEVDIEKEMQALVDLD